MSVLSQQFAAVMIAGALGVGARYSLDLRFAWTPGQFPVSTFLVNVMGSLLAGFIFGLAVSRASTVTPLSAALITGFCGGFTTFSAFGLQSYQMLSKGLWIPALVYILVSVVSCVLCVAAGAFLGKLI